MGMFDAFNINASGLTAQRFRMDVISENVANANTTRTKDGTPYVRKVVSFETAGNNTKFSKVLGETIRDYKGDGVKVTGVYEDKVSQMNMILNIITEMTNLIDASRAYEANATAFTASKSMASQGLNLGGGS